MRVPRIYISRQYAKLNISTRKSRQEIQSEKARFEVKQQPGNLKIKQKNIKVEIDNYPACYDLGYKNVADLSKENVKKVEKTVMNRIAKYARQGDNMMRIENGGNPLQAAIKEDSAPPKKEIGLKWKRGPEISLNPPLLDINYNPSKPQINAEKAPFNYEVKRGGVDISVAQYGEIEIDWEGQFFDKQV